MKMKKNLNDYELLWEKITDYVKATSRTTARPVLLLYYVLRSPETPSSVKMLIVAALSYLVLAILMACQYPSPVTSSEDMPQKTRDSVYYLVERHYTLKRSSIN